MNDTSATGGRAGHVEETSGQVSSGLGQGRPRHRTVGEKAKGEKEEECRYEYRAGTTSPLTARRPKNAIGRPPTHTGSNSARFC